MLLEGGSLPALPADGRERRPTLVALLLVALLLPALPQAHADPLDRRDGDGFVDELDDLGEYDGDFDRGGVLPEDVVPEFGIPQQVRTAVIENRPLEDVDPDAPEFALLEYVDQLRTAAAEAAADAEAAAEAAAQALVAERAAQFELVLATTRSAHAEQMLNQWAASKYRTDEPVSEIVDVVNSSFDDPGRVLDSRVWLQQASNVQEHRVRAAETLAAEADTALAAAEAAVERTQQLEEQTNQARRAAEQQLELAQDVIKHLAGTTVASQMVISADGCPKQVPDGTLRGGAEQRDVHQLCAESVAQAPTPQAALAIMYAFRALGAPYACNGVGRSAPFRYDCSSLVARAYAEGAGLSTAEPGWAPSTRDMVPWDGVELAPWAQRIDTDQIAPGDLLLYDTGAATTRHVVLKLADGYMLHTNRCGDVAHVTRSWGTDPDGGREFLVARRVDPQQAPGDGEVVVPDEQWLNDVELYTSDR